MGPPFWHAIKSARSPNYLEKIAFFSFGSPRVVSTKDCEIGMVRRCFLGGKDISILLKKNIKLQSL